ncbi:hypothetical protein [Metabacillus fastidiosus]|uniref:hypothetical protein n=1 Tax=Metabacillus fastidiosus TaxID=1458 RepID=UPI003D2C7236
MCNSFTLERYKNILEMAKANHYQFVTFHQASNTSSSDKIIILRHDIDLSLEKAVEMAELEKNQGVKATYFVMISSDFYNIWNKKSRYLIKKIMDYGHDIGLHFDESVYKVNNLNELTTFIEQEIDLLSKLIGQPVTIVSFHIPSRILLDSDLKLGKWLNTYENRFFTDIKYLSDSTRKWRGETIEEVLSKKEHVKIQLLIHPIWWNEKNLSFSNTIKKFANKHWVDMYDKLSSNLGKIPDEFRGFFHIDDE